MTHILKIDEMNSNPNKSENHGSSRYQERKFEEKLVDICNDIVAHSDDIWKISERMSDMSIEESSRFSTKDIHIESRKYALYIDFQKYDDKHVLLNVFNEKGNKYLTLTVDVPSFRKGGTLHSTLLLDYDLTDKEILYNLNKFFKCHYASYDGKGEVFVNLVDKDIYDDMHITMSGDEFFGLVSEFGQEFPAFIEHLKNELGIME